MSYFTFVMYWGMLVGVLIKIPNICLHHFILHHDASTRHSFNMTQLQHSFMIKDSLNSFVSQLHINQQATSGHRKLYLLLFHESRQAEITLHYVKKWFPVYHPYIQCTCSHEIRSFEPHPNRIRVSAGLMVCRSILLYWGMRHADMHFMQAAGWEIISCRLSWVGGYVVHKLRAEDVSAFQIVLHKQVSVVI
jgi:hypothetical protein